MLNYDVQYNIANGVLFCFNRNSSKKLLHVTDKQAVLDKRKPFFPSNKYEAFMKEDLVVVCLYIMLKEAPPSYMKYYELLKEHDYQTQGLIFKTEIISYKTFVQKDVQYLSETYGNPSIDMVMREYKKGNIKFYTAWFIFKIKGIDIEDYIETNRVNGLTVQRIKQTMLYITFSEKAYDYVKVLLKQTSLLGE